MHSLDLTHTRENCTEGGTVIYQGCRQSTLALHCPQGTHRQWRPDRRRTRAKATFGSSVPAPTDADSADQGQGLATGGVEMTDTARARAVTEEVEGVD